jgi:NADPH:quinone reductase-like Zn-dependent oxidoreductase
VYSRPVVSRGGTIAEYVDIESEYVAPKPKNIDFDHAAAVPLVGLTSYQSLFQYASLKAGQRVLILGGSSSCGIFGVQFAKAVGAYVVATTSAKNAELVKSIGADQTIDYHTQKWVDVLENHSIDLILDCGMEPASWNTDAQVVLKKDTSRFVSLLPIPEPIESPIRASQVFMNTGPSGADLVKIGEWIEAGKVKPVIDQVLSMDKVIEAVERVQTRRAVGKVIIKVL